MGKESSSEPKGRQEEREMRHLREQARARMQQTGMEVDFARLTPADSQALYEELLLHQVELTIQNEELQQAREELAAARDSYRDLFERAPVGYLILDGDGVIRGANETAAGLLGAVQGMELEGQAMADFVAASAQDQWFLHRRALSPGCERLVTELVLHCDHCPLRRRVHMETVPELGCSETEPRYRSVLLDITYQRQVEEDREQLIDLVEEMPQVVARRWPGHHRGGAGSG
ncbi:MAG: PAS domain-containing protein [Halorhodospira sp.]